MLIAEKTCACGCGGAIKPNRTWLRGHCPRTPALSMEERFWRNVNKGEGDECWQWQGSLIAQGYGRLKQEGGEKQVGAHRYSYELHKGPIPDGLQIDHLCRNRGCVNPDHLEAVTLRENVLRGTAFAASAVLQTECKRGHPLSGDNVDWQGPHGRWRACKTCQRLRNRGLI